MTRRLAEPVALVQPTYWSAPEYHETLGPEVGELAALAGFPPDPEQQLILDAQFGLDKQGRHTAFEVGVVCNRQNLKTGLIKQAALGKIFVLERNLFVWSAHEFSTAQEAFRDLTVLIESTPILDQRVKRIYRGNGDEAIELRGGQRIKFKARTQSGGRGLSGDDVALDEAFALEPAHMGALLPVLSTRPDPQVLYASSAGLAKSAVLRGIRDRGRAGTSRRLVWCEWTDEGECEDPACAHQLQTPGCRYDDRDAWAAVNPAVARGRISLDYIAAERDALPPEEFGRERMGRWDDPFETSAAFGPGRWDAIGQDLDDPAVEAPTDPVGIGLAVSIDRAYASIGAVSSAGHLAPVLRTRGTAQAVAEAGRISKERNIPVVIDGKGPASSLVPELEGMSGVTVLVAGTDDYLKACADLFDAVADGDASHGRYPELDDAVAAATKRTVMDRWAWARKNGEISMLEAVTLAWICYVQPKSDGFNIW